MYPPIKHFHWRQNSLIQPWIFKGRSSHWGTKPIPTMASKLTTMTDKHLIEDDKKRFFFLQCMTWPLLEVNLIPTDRDTGFNEPLSMERNTTLPHPASETAGSESEEHDLQKTTVEHVGVGQKMKGEIKIVEGKMFCSPKLVEEGRALKHGIPIENGMNWVTERRGAQLIYVMPWYTQWIIRGHFVSRQQLRL